MLCSKGCTDVRYGCAVPAGPPADRPAGGRLRDAESAALFRRLLGRQLRRMLRVVDPEVQGGVCRPDAVRVGAAAPAAAPGRNGRRHGFEALQSYVRAEPRLEVIGRGLTRARRLASLCSGDAPLAVDGFRLRDLSQWAGYSSARLCDNIAAISSYCTCECEFCYERGTRGAGIALGKVQLGMREVETRIRYYSEERKTGLLPSSRFSLEPFANPRCLCILERMREASPDGVIDFTTNGAALTDEVVARLARLKPLFIVVSMNAATLERRILTMRDKTPSGAETALGCLERLRRHEIPFAASYVPWPSKPLSDLEDAIRLFDRFDAAMVRVCMPGWTAYSHREAPFDTDSYWREIVEVTDRMRREVSVPVNILPNMYELRSLRPFIHGAIRNSPAAAAGLRYGDLILAVEGRPVFTRPEVTGVLSQRFADPDLRSTTLSVQRDGAVSDVVLHHSDPSALGYPYRALMELGVPRVWAPSGGICLADGLELSSFMKLKEVVADNPGKRILFFVSPLAAPLFMEGMAMLGEEAGFIEQADLFAEVLWPRAWGGNVMIGDLWTVQDVVEQTREWIERQGVRPDVVVLPVTFLSTGARDLRGHCYVEAERALGLEVRLLQCARIWV